MTTADQKVYVVQVTGANIEVVAYQGSNGQRLWNTHLKDAPDRTAYRLRMEDTLLQVYTYPHYEATLLYQLDTTGIGEVYSISQTQNCSTGELWLQTEDRIYWYTDDTNTKQTSLTASDSHMNVLWKWPMPTRSRYVKETPTVRGQQMFLSFENSVVNLDLNTGHLTWQTPVTPEIVSNFAVGERTGCFLRRDAALVCLNLETGAAIGELYFQPATDPNRARYRVMIMEEMILVYFGDSKELIALGP